MTPHRHLVAALAVGVACGALWDLVLSSAFQATGLTEGIQGPLMLVLVVLFLIVPTFGLDLLLLWPAPRPRFLLSFVGVALLLWLWAVFSTNSALIMVLPWPVLLCGAGLWAALERWDGTPMAAIAAAPGWNGHRTRGALALTGFLIWKSAASVALLAFAALGP